MTIATNRMKVIRAAYAACVKRDDMITLAYAVIAISDISANACAVGVAFNR